MDTDIDTHPHRHAQYTDTQAHRHADTETQRHIDTLCSEILDLTKATASSVTGGIVMPGGAAERK